MRSRFNKWLLCSFFFIGLMLAARIYISGNIAFIFLIWNLFLAWIPYLISGLILRSRTKAVWIQSLIFISWLLFFPNALYLITDLIHLQPSAFLPLWFDAILLFTASFTGLALAFASLRNMEIFISSIALPVKPAYITMILLFAGSFGVYLGRFERWNSWNIITSPMQLITDVCMRFVHPFQHFHTWAVVALLTALYSLCWFFTKIFIPHPLKTSA